MGKYLNKTWFKGAKLPKSWKKYNISRDRRLSVDMHFSQLVIGELVKYKQGFRDNYRQYRLFLGLCYLRSGRANVMTADLEPFIGVCKSTLSLTLFRKHCLLMGLISVRRRKVNFGYSGYVYLYDVTEKGWEYYREYCDILGIRYRGAFKEGDDGGRGGDNEQRQGKEEI